MNNGRDCAHGRQVGKCDTCDLIDAEKRINELEQENATLTKLLKKVNNQAEHFERQWYLRGDELEALTVQVEQLREFILTVNRNCAAYIMDGKRINFEKLGAAAYDLYKSTPVQCLAERDAEVAKAAFYECYFQMRKCKDGDVFDLVLSAEQYANQLRKQADGE